MKSNVENRVKRILGISLAVILMSGNFIPSYATVAAADHTDTATVKTESVNTLSYDNQDDPDKKEEDQNLKVTISQEKDFETGQTAFISEIIDEKKLEEYKNSLNSDVLQSERSEIEEIKLAAEIAVRDKDGKDAELKVNTMEMNRRIYNPEFKCCTLTCVNGGYHIKSVMDHGRPRKLTPVEYERLQGLPDGYTDVEFNGRKMSDTKRYSMMGNGWNEPTVEWILSGLKKR